MHGLITIVKLIIPHLSLFKFLSGYRQRGQVGINEDHPHIRIFAEIEIRIVRMVGGCYDEKPMLVILNAPFFRRSGGLNCLPHSFSALFFSVVSFFE